MVVIPSFAVQPLAGALVTELTRYLPGAYAGRELLRLRAPGGGGGGPAGGPRRHVAPAWDAALGAGKESVVCDLKEDPGLARALCARADVVLEGFRPGVAERLGLGPADLPERVVYCSITGFGLGGPHAAYAGHDLNYLGWAGGLADTAPAPPPAPPPPGRRARAEVLRAALRAGRAPGAHGAPVRPGRPGGARRRAGCDLLRGDARPPAPPPLVAG